MIFEREITISSANSPVYDAVGEITDMLKKRICAGIAGSSVSVSYSGVSESTYLEVSILDEDGEDMENHDGETYFKIRVSGHKDRHGGNDAHINLNDFASWDEEGDEATVYTVDDAGLEAEIVQVLAKVAAFRATF